MVEIMTSLHTMYNKQYIFDDCELPNFSDDICSDIARLAELLQNVLEKRICYNSITDWRRYSLAKRPLFYDIACKCHDVALSS